MKNPSFFKPNKNNTGSLASFQFGKDDKGLALYVDIIRQDPNSWNGRTGSFRNNAQRGNPNNVKTKLSAIEAAAIVKCVNTFGKIPFNAFHTSDNGNVRINFTSAPSKNEKDPSPVFFINIAKDEGKFTTMLTTQEAALLAIYIEAIISREFYEGFVQHQKQRQQYRNDNNGNVGYQKGNSYPTQQKTTPSPQPQPQFEQEDGEIFDNEFQNQVVEDSDLDFDSPF